MKKFIISLSFLAACLLVGNFVYSQTLILPGGTINVGPVLMGQTSADGAHSFTITGTGYTPGTELYTDSYDSRFKISLTGLTGTYVSSLAYYADGAGNVNETIYVNYTPTSIGQVVIDLEFYDFETFKWQYQAVRGIGSGPEILIEGRPGGGDPWDEILDGETTPVIAEGTDFGDALANSEIVSRTFQITNAKEVGGLSGNLVLSEYTTAKYVLIGGFYADQFTVTVEPTTPIAAGNNTTTFTIEFEPTSAGVKTATLTILNNDPDENPYNFTIVGTGVVTAPGAPTANAASQIDNNNFYANWTVGGGGVTEGYYLDVATDAAFTNFVTGFQAKDVGLVTTKNVTGLDPLTDYYFRVTAYNVGGSGPVSNTQMLTTAPSVPIAQPASNIDVESFYANWGFVAGATSYKLDVNTQANFAGTAILTDATVFNNYYYVVGLTGGSTYYYRVRSNNGNSSENSGIVSAFTLCNAPVAIAATAKDSTQFTANWVAPSGGAPDFYKLDVSEVNTFSTYVPGYQNLTVYSTSKVVTGLSQNTRYYYRVRAVNVSGVSASSNIISLYTYTSSTTATWTGATSTGWNVPGNWDTGIPGSGTDAIIALTANQPVVAMNSFCKDLTVNAGARLTVGSGKTLTVGGNVLLKSDASGNASLIETGGLITAGTEKAQLYLTESRWHFISTPMTNASTNIFEDIYLRYWDEAIGDWVYIENLGDPLLPGEGYSAWTSTLYLGNTTVTYQGGTFNQGPVNLPVAFSGGDGWNVVGNPYPSAVDWDHGSWVKSNIDAAIYVWDGSQYLVWNGTFGDLTDGVIPAYQSFYTKASAASPVLQVNNGARVHGPAAYKDSEVSNLIEVQAFGNGYSDITYIHFNENATPAYDSEFDAYKLFGIEEAPQIFSIVGDDILAINSLPSYNQSMVIPLGFKAEVDAEYTIRINNLSSFDFPLTIVIEDVLTGNMIDMSAEDDFTFTSSKDQVEGRFLIHFMSLMTDVDEMNIENNFNIYSNDQSIYIKNMTTEITTGNVFVYNISGQEIVNSKLQNTPINRIDMKAESGYYIVKVLTDNKVITQKVFIE
ncbi:MAG: fibronectin type III domain-containing protein [Bacteroidales bacterium]|nr:fibronectin type III domain-containing protein [Bacteroidales bacterium]MCF8405017.1 fibronectin type III domain-containing protein [Bacteroidales bacterium]